MTGNLGNKLPNFDQTNILLNFIYAIFRVDFGKMKFKSKHNFSIFLIFSAFTILIDLSVQDAFAYLDPSSGTLAIQMILGTLVGVGITLKIYWYKIKEKFNRNK